MSAYNRVQVGEEETCPSCQARIRRWVQLKYGAVRLFDYQIGETIRWTGGQAIGEPGTKHVVASGHPEPCPNCGDIPGYRYEIDIREDRVVSLARMPVDTEHQRFGHESFVVIDK